MKSEQRPTLVLATPWERLEFDVYQSPETPPPSAGVFVLLERTVESGRGLVRVLRIGEAADIADTVFALHDDPGLKENRFNAVAVLSQPVRSERERIVSNLLETRRPACQQA